MKMELLQGGGYNVYKISKKNGKINDKNGGTL